MPARNQDENNGIEKLSLLHCYKDGLQSKNRDFSNNH
jgi:hypothetical protein